MQLKAKDLEPSPLSFYYDQMGRVFFINNKIYRGIHKEYKDQVNQLFKSGLISELEEKGLFPRTIIVDIFIEGYELVLEHDKIDIVSYPYEWTFSKLKLAALCILEVNIIASKYGYITQDCHPYNILFKKNKPVFIDLGSFVKTKDFTASWIINEFDVFYTFPLLAWQDDDTKFSKLLLSAFPDDYTTYKYQYSKKYFKTLFWSNEKIANKFHVFFIHNNDNGFLYEKWATKTKVKYKLASRLFPLPLRQNFTEIKQHIDSINYTGDSYWSDYLEDNIDNDFKNIKSTPRFERIIEVLKKIEFNSSYEMASSYGLFTYLLRQSRNLQKSVCSDYDPRSCENMFEFATAAMPDIEAVYTNIIFPIYHNLAIPAHNRFKSDIVIALAVTHHLILTQKISIDVILKTLANYSEKYILTEFMPLGLWHDNSAPPFPDWYNIDWFKENFEKHFHIIHQEQTEENRIFFLGELKEK